MTNYLLTFCFVLITNFSFSQQSKIDSLLSLLKTDKPDTSKIEHLNELAWEISYSNPDTAMILSKQALQLAINILNESEKKWDNSEIKEAMQTSIGQCYHQIATFHTDKGEYFLALQFFQKALDVWEQLENSITPQSGKYSNEETIKRKEKYKNKKAATYGNIGNVYAQQGDYPKTLEYYFKALKIGEETKDENRIAIQLGNIGIVFFDQKDYHKALDYYFKALKIKEDIKDNVGLTATIMNIAEVYKVQGDYSKALDYNFKALKMSEDLGNKSYVATVFGNLGTIYDEQKDYSKALDYYFKALKIDEDIGNKNGIARHNNNIGYTYYSIKKYSEAEKFYLKALTIANEIGSFPQIQNLSENLSDLYTDIGNYKKALEHYKIASAAKDTLWNANQNKEITRRELNYEFEKKEATAKAEQEKKDLKKDLITGFSLVGLILMLAFVWFAFRSLRVSTKQTFLIIAKFLSSFFSRPKIFGNKDKTDF